MTIEPFELRGRTIRDSYTKEIKTMENSRYGKQIHSTTVLVIEFTDGTAIQLTTIHITSSNKPTT